MIAQDLCLFRPGLPTAPICATWLKERAEQYTTSPISRFRSFDDWSKFQERILKDAGKHRNR
ncbi:hypothetical protein, partial [Streptomyces lunaelactis]|uniref:hypothetical protein n=1 Tax=Streptomyces lunaelactis TaxID=1535768 RepID=UPI001C2F4E51